MSLNKNSPPTFFSKSDSLQSIFPANCVQGIIFLLRQSCKEQELICSRSHTSLHMRKSPSTRVACMYPSFLLSVSLHFSMPRRPAASRPSPCSNLLLFPLYLFAFKFIRLCKKKCFHIFTLAIAFVSDLRKRQHTHIVIMLQGALTDIRQPAHIPFVRPICVLAFLSECLVAAFL